MQKSKSEKKSKKATKNTDVQSKGLGDTVEKVFKATGVDKIAKWALGEDCGCDERKEKLNKLFPYAKPNCLNEDEFNYLKEYFTNKPSAINLDTQKRLVDIYNRVLNQRAKTTSCSPCFLNGVHAKLFKLYNEYEK